MSGVLVVTQASRSIGEFRRPWVRTLYRRYVDRYRRAVAGVVRRLVRSDEVTLLTARELVGEAALPSGVRVRYYDTESYAVDSEALSRLTRRLASGWWPVPEREPSLLYRGVWLPDLLSIARGIVLRLEVTEPLGIVEKVFGETKPDRVVLVSDTSIPEQLARLLAERDGLPAEVAAPRFGSAHLYGLAHRALFSREERLRVRDFLSYPRHAQDAPSFSSDSRILFVTCRPRHHQVVDPLVAAVRSAGVEARVIASPNPERDFVARLEALGRAGVPWGYLTDYLPRADAVRLVRRYRPVFREVWRRIDGAPEIAGRLVWKEVPLAGIARPFLRDSVERSLLAALLFQEAAGRALDALRPSAVIVTSNRRYTERALALAARERRIPCLIFSNNLFLGRDRAELFDIGDRILALGEHLRQALTDEQGVDLSRISVLGDPRSNGARLVPPPRLREEVFRDFGFTGDRPLLVVVSKYVSVLFSIQEKEAFYRTVAAAIPLLGEPHVIVKVHPNENLELLRQQVRAWGWPDAILAQEYDIHRLFGAAGAAIMVTSMAGIEAMVMGCPVVAVQTPGKDFEGEYMLPYVSEGVVERVDMGDPAALAAALRRLLTDGAARVSLIERGRAFAARYVHPADGRLAERLLCVIEEVRDEISAGRLP